MKGSQIFDFFSICRGGKGKKKVGNTSRVYWEIALGGIFSHERDVARLITYVSKMKPVESCSPDT